MINLGVYKVWKHLEGKKLRGKVKSRGRVLPLKCRGVDSFGERFLAHVWFS